MWFSGLVLSLKHILLEKSLKKKKEVTRNLVKTSYPRTEKGCWKMMIESIGKLGEDARDGHSVLRYNRLACLLCLLQPLYTQYNLLYCFITQLSINFKEYNV